MAERRTKDEYIRQHIQYENLTRANRFFTSALFVVPVGMAALECLIKEDLWYYGDTWMWILAAELMFVVTVLAIHRKAENRSGDHRYFLYEVWAVYLIATDLLAFNLQSPVIAQILLWSATLKFITSYLSNGRGSNIGLSIQVATSAGLIFFHKLGVDIIAYNVMLMYACHVLSDHAYQLYIQKMEDRWMLRLANRESAHDPMSGLLNRRGFEPKAAQMLQLCRKKHQPAGMIMIDIDNFKKYNDTFGHPEGDKCIIAVAKQLQRLTAEMGGCCARIGGEEFVVMLRGVSEVDFVQFAKKLKMAVEELKLPQAPGNFYPYVTISIGLDHHKRILTETYEEMYHTADQALYRAKDGGRNCIYMKETRVSTGITRYFA